MSKLKRAFTILMCILLTMPTCLVSKPNNVYAETGYEKLKTASESILTMYSDLFDTTNVGFVYANLYHTIETVYSYKANPSGTLYLLDEDNNVLASESVTSTSLGTSGTNTTISLEVPYKYQTDGIMARIKFVGSSKAYVTAEYHSHAAYITPNWLAIPGTENITDTNKESVEWNEIDSNAADIYSRSTGYFDIQGTHFIGVNVSAYTETKYRVTANAPIVISIKDTEGESLKDYTVYAGDILGSCWPDYNLSTDGTIVAVPVPKELYSSSNIVKIATTGKKVNDGHGYSYTAWSEIKPLNIYTSLPPKPVFSGDFSSGNLT